MPFKTINGDWFGSLTLLKVNYQIPAFEWDLIIGISGVYPVWASPTLILMQCGNLPAIKLMKVKKQFLGFFFYIEICWIVNACNNFFILLQ